MNFVEIIANKRDGKVHSREELAAVANGAADETVPDYQLTAWLMAAFLNGLNEQETADLTMAMAKSGERLDLTGLPKPWLDKHSTGGVGDKTTMVLLPLLAACGLTVVKMSGRGLGITGGTIDKLSSIPDMRLDLTPEEMKTQAERIGLALTGQTPRLAPADGRLYALRDVTGTVANLPLIVSSILSKKIAGGAELVVLDVKCGSGAFMKTVPEAIALAKALERTGALAGLTVKAHVTDMDQPLGRAVGNALEVKEAIRVLKGEAGRFADLCQYFAVEALKLAGRPDPEVTVKNALASGEALEKAKEWINAQDGDVAIFSHEDWQLAPVMHEVFTQEAGWISGIDAHRVGEIAINLGAGRRKKSDIINPTVGLVINVSVGDHISKGQPIAVIHAADRTSADQAGKEFAAAITYSPTDVQPRPVLLDTKD